MLLRKLLMGAEVEYSMSSPRISPDDTRAYFRAHALRRFGEAVSSMDWSRMRFRVPGARHWWSSADIPMQDPCQFNRAQTEALFYECETLEELVEAANSLDSMPAVRRG